ncbi:MAG: HoxN/HupN/NixA family nickel/cobalt transporter [Chloroflexota bacterium]
MNELLFAVSSFILGGLHALEPGHGKTVVAAYLVGSKGRVSDAILLGGVVTFTHTFSIIILGILTAVAAAYLVPETVHEVLEVVSGLLVLGVGLWMVNDRVIKGRAGHDHDHSHGHEHQHEHSLHSHQEAPTRQAQPELVGAFVAHAHDGFAHDHPLRSAPAQGEPNHAHDEHGHGPAPRSGERPSLGGLVTLGISGGIVPCPAALALLLAAVGAGNILGGLSLVVIFSLGLAVVLVAIGITLVKATDLATRRLGDRLNGNGALARQAGMASAVVITLLGAFLTARAALHVAGIAALD